MNGTKLTGPQVTAYLIGQAKQIPSFAAVIAFMGFMIWELWAEDKVEIQIKVHTTPIEKQVKSNTNDLKQIGFEVKQILLILEKTNSKKVVQEVQDETEKFRPDTSKEN